MPISAFVHTPINSQTPKSLYTSFGEGPRTTKSLCTSSGVGPRTPSLYTFLGVGWAVPLEGRPPLGARWHDQFVSMINSSGMSSGLRTREFSGAGEGEVQPCRF